MKARINGTSSDLLVTRIVDLGSVQVKAFELKYSIATSVNFTPDLKLMYRNWKNSEEFASNNQWEKSETTANEL